jgi:hypothetical protein
MKTIPTKKMSVVFYKLFLDRLKAPKNFLQLDEKAYFLTITGELKAFDYPNNHKIIC